jgi:hypothetical protein
VQQRTRRIVAGFLVVVGGIVLAVSSIGWWAEKSLLNTAHVTSEANTILAENDVQTALTQVVVRQLSRAAGTDLRLAEPFLASVVQQVVQSGPFRTIFDAALSRAHHVLVSRDSTNLVLDLAKSYEQIRSTLEQVAPKLAGELPGERELRVVLLKREQLTVIYDTIDQVKRAVDVLTAIGVLLVVVGVAVAPRRWRALALTGFVVVGASAVFLLTLVIGRAILHSRIGDPVYANAARAVFVVVTRGLVIQSAVIMVVAGAVAVAAIFTDRHGLAAWPRATRRTWAWVVAAVPVGLPDGDAEPRAGELEPVPGPGVVLAKLRLPEPREQVRRAHVVRALVLLSVGLVAVFDTDALTSFIVVAFGVVALYFAVVEGLAAWRAPKQAA